MAGADMDPAQPPLAIGRRDNCTADGSQAAQHSPHSPSSRSSSTAHAVSGTRAARRRRTRQQQAGHPTRVVFALQETKLVSRELLKTRARAWYHGQAWAGGGCAVSRSGDDRRVRSGGVGFIASNRGGVIPAPGE